MKRTKHDLGLTDDVSLLNTTPRILPTPTVRFDLRSFKKDTTDPKIYKQLYLKLISEYPNSTRFLPMAEVRTVVLLVVEIVRQALSVFRCTRR